MADVFTKAKRSEVMSRIRGRGNKDTELALAKVMRTGGITGWRRNQKVFGKPDFVFRKARMAVFVDGCFWHACPKHSNMPASNRAFWKKNCRQTGFATNWSREHSAAGVGVCYGFGNMTFPEEEFQGFCRACCVRWEMTKPDSSAPACPVV